METAHEIYVTGREFYVETPLGKLKVWAKHMMDSPDDYPGAYIDLVRDGFQDEMLACTEYDHCSECLQTCVYQPGIDEPTSITVHDVSVAEIPPDAFAEELKAVLRASMGSDYAGMLAGNDAFANAVKQDVEETSAWRDEGHYSDDDIRLAVGRTVAVMLGMEI